HALQRQPAADVVPAVRRLHHQHLGGVLHDGVVDADLRQRLVLALEDARAVGAAPALGDALHGGVQLRLPLLQGVQDRRRPPDEDAAVPEILARRQVALRRLAVRLLDEFLYAEHGYALTPRHLGAA